MTSLSKGPQAQIRTFLAIELPPEVREALTSITAELGPYRSILKVVAPESQHLTVRFIGGVPTARIAEVEEAAREAAAVERAFSLTLSRPGAFPERGGVPRVVWVGLREDGGYRVLQHLFAVAERGLTARGFAPERRPYSPHLTIARVREEAPRDVARRLRDTVGHLAAARALCASFEVNQLTVMLSDLGRAGPTYTPLARVPLAGSKGTGP